MLRALRSRAAQRIGGSSMAWLSGATSELVAGGRQGAACSGSGSGLAAAAGLRPEAAVPWALQHAAPFSKKAKKGAAAEAAPQGDAAASFDMKDFKEQMEKSLEHLQGELANIRTGRATPGMLDHLKVDVYGDRLPLKACGSVSVRDPQLLAITVFDQDAVPSVVKAVAESPLRLSPRAEGQEVLVPIPRPTIETIAAMMKVAKVEGEQAKVSVRHARKLAMDAAKKLASEDERKRVEKEVQRVTDDYITQIDGMVAKKEKSIKMHDS
ncbi:Ribosome-recycling factor [Chlorella sorokiniana]|uniref:Ribosome-recycling factor, chloroplastic n=1 Tax=Chlorella sorokiniana TaxID=3076 RepID=A0A2P6TZJ8_CHLSO|nr:Ribosome-recycling factor [Chlorella sorokiniana]|eukprot:PRW59470.1 Ribosome-recycling factor [Chlorella sorokiniana]